MAAWVRGLGLGPAGEEVRFVVNPASSGGRAAGLWASLGVRVRETWPRAQVVQTAASGDGARLARQAALEGCRLVVAVGGDGTVGEVVDGLMEAGGARTELGVLPLATGGDLVRTLGIPRDPAAALAHLVAAGPRRLDVGRVSYTAPGGEEARRHFINVASFGTSGEVVARVNRSHKPLGGRIAFAWASLAVTWGAACPTVHLSLDGEPAEPRAVRVVAVANGRCFGGGMRVAPKALPDDGLFDVVVVGAISRWEALRRGPALYRGTHLGLPDVSCRRARRVEARAEGGVEVLLDVDGEQPGRLPASFEVLPGALAVRA
ncbi:MAG: diacylglycerol kinase family lipid kinase [Planctomycetes bacterium]|nr:diacylglycerol kinase family lipid kinase [Planctomycetota bacterium]